MSDAPPSVVSVTIDGTEVDARPGEMVIAAAERAGIDIPHFCYHPRMTPVGMCRMCLVDIDTGRGPMLQPSCMVPVSDGMSVDTESPATKRAQEGILELLLVNHPLDCPVCDKGGECPLQDQTVAFGPGESRYVEEKRHYEKPIPISDLVHLDRERCILCDRCTRFADEVAGDPLIHFTERGNETQVLTFPDEPFSSYFSGNTVQICPVGALTAAPYRFKARPWDLEQIESTCTTCSVGCRVAVQSSRNELVRYLGVDVDPVNHGWLCDKGRFDFEAVNSDERLTAPLMRDPQDDQQLVGTDWGTALAAAAEAIGGSSSVGIIGGALLTNEDAYAWSKLARSVIGTDNVDAQLGDGLPAEAMLGLPAATIDAACAADAVLVIGPDLKETLPILHLRLRAAARRGTKIVQFVSTENGLSSYAHRTVLSRPGEAAADLRSFLDSEDPLAGQLRDGSVVVVLGRGSLAESARPALDAAAVVREHLPSATFLPAVPRGNVRGAIDMGLSPGLLPGRVTLDQGRSAFAAAWGSVPSSAGLDTTGMLEAAAAGRIDTLVLLGADPLVDFPDHDLAQRGLAGVRTVIAVDTFATASVRRADIVLAATAYGEKGGTTTNLEGRVSRLGQKVTAPGSARDDWMIAAELAWRLDGDLGFGSVEEIWREVTELAPSHGACTVEAVSSAEARDGLLVTGGSVSIDLEAPADPPAVDGYALRLVAGRKLWDAGTGVQQSASLAQLAEDAVLAMNPTDLERLGVAEGDRVNVTSTRTTVVLQVLGDEGVPRGVVTMPYNQPNLAAGALIDSSTMVTDVRVETR
ncbi:MAG: NADH-quinone oxidoreductase subunit NuoG [Actinomycetota bacterium]|nr:NADH-quinone oxidoreductase subunit NuoG [Actinomycetota bacterium]